MSRAYRALVLGVCFVGLLGACTTSGNGLPPKVEPSDDSTLTGGGGAGGAGTPGDGGTSGAAGADAAGGRTVVGNCVRPEKTKSLGAACGCHDECDSGSCVDGVCCSSACNGTCQACNVPGKAGTCSPVPAGMRPANPAQCTRDDIATCGSDGTCDGNGACRRYPDGTSCSKGTCDAATIVGAKVCKAGKCDVGPNTICAPFGCKADTVQCIDKCTTDAECAKGQTCKNGSCGKKNLGAQCGAAGECDSGVCADGVCCNTTCGGACVSCNQLSKMGECTATTKDLPDPHKVCKDMGAASCGTSGSCDGSGGCSKYGPTTTCRDAKCEGANQVPASSCDGKGSCRAGNQVICAPFTCSGNACKVSCTVDSECSSGNVCRNGTCGLRGKGQDCSSNAQCGTGFCVDGVCCENSCAGQCKFCASSQAKGSCINVAASTPDPRAAAGITDPAKICAVQDRTSCGRNGMCNGTGGCQVWDNKTMCESQSCAANTNTVSLAKMCDGFGVCKAQGSQSCPPYKCNGSACGNACGSDNDCVAPNACVAGKCGKKPPGGLCNNANECSSGFCSQGVCCQTDCKGSCFSCSLPNSRGSCTAVPSGALDPANVCKDDGVSSCDRDGTCDGSGKCRLYANGQICAGATCVAGTATGISACNGKGDCLKGVVRACQTYKCNADGTGCYESCVDGNQCVSPNVCKNSSCGLQPIGAPCPLGNAQCAPPGLCFQGSCCATQCDGVCKSCGLQGKEGTCTNIPKGSPDIAVPSRCIAALPTTCGNDGFCDGNGACGKYGTTVPCRDQSCPANSTTQTLAATCDGAGNCPSVQTKDCKLILCNPATNACYTGCSLPTQCVSTSYCDTQTMSCGGLKDQGTSCTDSVQCKTGLKCVNGVCCGGLGNANACPVCQSCAAQGKIAGTCQSEPAGPNGSCPAGDCLVAACSANGTCAVLPQGQSCGTPNCNTATNTPRVFQCSANGSCAEAPAGKSCGDFLCVAGACPFSCKDDADCVSGKVCSGTKCQDPKKINGTKCGGPGSGGECASGYCVDNVCCDTTCGAACMACDLTNKKGTCSPLPINDMDTSCTGSCNSGKCGMNGCEVITCPSSCSTDGTKEMGQSCSAAPSMCVPATDKPCTGGFKCVGTACLAQCTLDTECQDGYYCQNNNQQDTSTYRKCQPKKAPSAALACSRNAECTNGICANGYCCNSACTDSCKTCAGSSLGTCSNVGAGGDDPAGMCMNDNVSLCGTTGKCDGVGGCQKRIGTSCGVVCSVDLLSTIAKTCDGTGMCLPGAPMTCSGFLCAEPSVLATGSAACSSVPVNPPDAGAPPGP
jgi:hypothetical protein